MCSHQFITVAACFLLFSFSNAGEVPEALKEMGHILHAHCLSETGTDKEIIDNARLGKFSDDPKFKCYLRCLYDETSLLEDGKFDKDAMIGLFPLELRPTFEPIINKCYDRTGVDECDMIYQITKCFFDMDPVNSFIL